MAKQQTFGDKSKKKGVVDFVNVKVIQAYESEKGTVRYYERFVRVADLKEVDNIELGK